MSTDSVPCGVLARVRRALIAFAIAVVVAGNQP